MEVTSVSASTRRTKDTSKVSKPEKTLAALPTKELAWVRMKTLSGDVFILTATQERTTYTLYQVVADGFQRIAKSTSPKELDAIVYPPVIQKQK